MSDDKWHGHGIFDQDCLKCRIAELEAERDKLREALELIANRQGYWTPDVAVAKAALEWDDE